MIKVKTATSPKTGEKPFEILYRLPSDINVVVLIGGRGGMKTYEASKFVAFSSTIKKKRCVVLRDEKELIRESILNEILLRFDTANATGKLSAMYERLDTGIKDRLTNEMVVFTKGFRASSAKKTSNLKGSSNIDIAVIEEAEDIRDENKFNTFADSIRKEGSVIIIILNTPDINHWIIKRYFNLVVVEDGFFDIEPKELPGFLCIKTSFEDNPYLPEHIKSNYNNYGNPESHLYNPYYYNTAIKGLASTGRKGQILTKVKPIKLKDYLALPYKEVYGQDFGTASAAGLVGVKIHRNECWMRQLNYKPKDTLGLAKMYCDLRFTIRDKIVADSAEPHTIEKLQNGYKIEELSKDVWDKYPRLKNGFYVVPAIKGPGSIEYGIGLMTSMNLYCVEESIDAWNEINNWIYDVDKNHQPTDKPVDEYNHLMDPWRYAITDYKPMPVSNLKKLSGFLPGR